LSLIIRMNGNSIAVTGNPARLAAEPSPDGKYLFFTSNREGQDDIYWIEARVIDRLRPGTER
jgi:Tol biopolymer transport system component